MKLVFTQSARGSQTVEFISLFLAEERATQALSFLLAHQGAHIATRLQAATYLHLARQDAQCPTYLLELVACLLAEECTMQVICAFLDAKTTMQHIFDKHNATCLLLAQREVNNTTGFLFLAKWHTMQLISMTCFLPSRKDKHCTLIPPCSRKCRP